MVANVTFTSKNPMTGEVLWEGPESSDEEVHQAVASAENSLEEWAFLPVEARAQFLKQFAAALAQQADSFAVAISKETGKPLWESKAETASMAAKVEIAIEAYAARCPSSQTPHAQGTSQVRHKPLGVIGILGPYNFPGHLPTGQIAPALLAGNTVVFKPSEHTPLVGELLVGLWEGSGLPKGVIHLVQGGHRTGKALAKDPGIRGLLFTGSWKVGKLLAEQFGKTPDKLLALEMGGNNPLVIGRISNVEAAAYHIIQSAFLTSGQRCTCARRLIVPNGSLGESLLETLIDRVTELKIGGYADTPEPFMGPLINRHASNNLLTVEKSLGALGGSPLLPMKELSEQAPLLTPGIIDTTEMKSFIDEEHFGPLLQVIRVDSLEEAIRRANQTLYGLVAGILTDDPSEFELFYKKAKAGIINWNTPTTGALSTAPFGGIGKSGNFRPAGFYAADFCSYPVASLLQETLALPAKLPPGVGFK